MVDTSLNEEINEQFLKWCTEQGIDFNGNKLVIRESASKNRHIVSENFIPEGTVLFKIPYTALLNPINSPIKQSSGALETEELPEDSKEHSSSSDDEDSDEENAINRGGIEWKQLVVSIFQELKKGKTSVWYPYLQILPSSESHSFDNLYYWSEDELKMLYPSKSVDRLGLDKIKQMYEELQEEFDLSEMTFERFLQISSIIMSYSFDVNVKSLVPVADLLNASVNNNAILQVDDENEEFISMVAVKDIAAGEEVYNIYGDHPNGELLRMYGYVEEGNFNEFAEIELKSLLNIDPKYKDIVDKIDEVYDLEDPLIMDSYDVYFEGGLVAELIVLAEILTTYTAETTEEEIKKLIKNAFKKVVKKNQISPETKKVLDLLVAERIKEYSLTKSDGSNLEKGYSKPYMAHIVKKGELDCLQKCLQLIEKEYEIAADQETEEQKKQLERADKKRKRLEKRMEKKSNKKSKF